MSGFFDDGLNTGEIGPIAERAPSLHEVLDEVCREVDRAESKHAPMHSYHEGYAVLLEEVRELECEVFKGGSEPRDPASLRKEAIEVAAMAVRLIRDVCDGRNKP